MSLGATALVPGELRAVLAPSRLLLLVHANPCHPNARDSRNEQDVLEGR